MKRQLLFLVVAGLMGALGALAIQTWLQPTPAYAGTALSRLTQQPDGSLAKLRLKPTSRAGRGRVAEPRSSE